MDFFVCSAQVCFQLINLIVQKLHLLHKLLLLVEVVFEYAFCVQMIVVFRDKALVLVVEIEASCRDNRRNSLLTFALVIRGFLLLHLELLLFG